jgi:carboxylesterase type B
MQVQPSHVDQRKHAGRRHVLRWSSRKYVWRRVGRKRPCQEDFFGKELAPKILREYPASDYATPSDPYSAVLTSSIFACSAQAIDRWVADKTPTYAYEFADRTAPSYLDPTTFALGAAHTYEIQYLFPGFHGGSLSREGHN